MTRGSHLRAHRFAAPSAQIDRGATPADRHLVAYWCGADHRTVIPLATDIDPPEAWPCRKCGAIASRERGAAPPSARERVFPRTPYEFLMMRRSPEDGERILAEAVENLRRARRRH